MMELSSSHFTESEVDGGGDVKAERRIQGSLTPVILLRVYNNISAA